MRGRTHDRRTYTHTHTHAHACTRAARTHARTHTHTHIFTCTHERAQAPHTHYAITVNFDSQTNFRENKWQHYIDQWMVWLYICFKGKNNGHTKTYQFGSLMSYLKWTNLRWVGVMATMRDQHTSFVQLLHPNRAANVEDKNAREILRHDDLQRDGNKRSRRQCWMRICILCRLLSQYQRRECPVASFSWGTRIVVTPKWKCRCHFHLVKVRNDPERKTIGVRGRRNTWRSDRIDVRLCYLFSTMILMTQPLLSMSKIWWVHNAFVAIVVRNVYIVLVVNESRIGDHHVLNYSRLYRLSGQVVTLVGPTKT